MSVALALAGAVLFGTGDFLGGLASRRIAVLSVLVVSQCTGLIGMLLVSVVVRGSPSGVDLLLGAAAGVAGGAGVAFLYRGLATGTMSLVAPVTGVVAAAVPVAAGVAFGERLATLQVVGIVMAVGSVALLGGGASAPDSTRRARPLGLALGSGVGFGLFYIAMSRTGASAGLWPIVAARGATVTIFTVAAAGTRVLRQPLGGNLALLVATGVFDVAGNAFYLVAVRAGLLSIVAVLISLYPAATVVCSMAVLGERLRRVQTAGVIAALIAVVLIAAG